MSKSLHLVQNLTGRAIFQIAGNDAEKYLNGQISQDVKLASADTAVYSIVANFKGKLAGDCFIRRYKGNLLIDTCSSQRDSLLIRLDKYLISDDAEITDISDDYHFWHVIGSCEFEFPQPGWICNRYGVAGTDYIFPSSETLPLASNKQEIEQLRIINKIPIWGRELDDNTLPPEAGLEDRAISYTKGCYTGQEVISRMKSAGKTNRHIVQIQSDLKINTPLDLNLSAAYEGKPAVVITSSCQLDEKWIGLGYRSRKAQRVDEFYDKEGKLYSVI